MSQDITERKQVLDAAAKIAKGKAPACCACSSLNVNHVPCQMYYNNAKTLCSANYWRVGQLNLTLCSFCNSAERGGSISARHHGAELHV